MCIFFIRVRSVYCENMSTICWENCVFQLLIQYTEGLGATLSSSRVSWKRASFRRLAASSPTVIKRLTCITVL